MSDPYARMDPSDDARFYAVERKVVHIEQGAIEALRARYAQLLRPGATVLDLMSSWRSHLPDGLGRVVGLGMNAAELADNPQLDQYLVHDLNQDPTLPFEDGAFDAVVCAVSIQYLVRPVEVLSEVRRVLRPAGHVVISFSNRCFPTKAVAVWLATSDREHGALVRRYLEQAGFTGVTDDRVPTTDDPLYVVVGSAGAVQVPPDFQVPPVVGS
jgi:SAM-dependent methyltransferase